ncbi:K+-transporting ATPase, F subunit [Pirellula staleyi DSM 6068]|uniref:K+-transporting ATPase, F subunit n=1 Tax=Pirellula staleyi (strain ATCC 27377 / DSM 6068 / ICPB 4128) TaxID=530564 RepID=D2R318_PIRSD|nr:K+-transporting ATPase, F subunit [Pirellula staleyi DSM 6068]
MDFALLLSLVMTLGLGGYLLVALMMPEKFS